MPNFYTLRLMRLYFVTAAVIVFLITRFVARIGVGKRAMCLGPIEYHIRGTIAVLGILFALMLLHIGLTLH